MAATLVGSTLALGFFGWLLDRWLHYEYALTLALGTFGFAAGLTLVIRRLVRSEKSGPPGASGA